MPRQDGDLMEILNVGQLEILLVAAAFIVLISRKIRIPYTVGLVLGGAVLASLGILDGVSFTKDLVFGVLLPPLIFEGAFFIEWKQLRVELLPVLVLATVGVLVTAAVVTTGMYLAGTWSFAAALLYGALISATDPVSVIALFKELKTHGRLRLLVEAESLFNDGAAAGLFAVAMLTTEGAHPSISLVSTAFVQEVGGGLLTGVVVGIVAVFCVRRTMDHLVQLTFTATAAFGAFLAADYLHFSGVLAVLVCGLIVGTLGEIGCDDPDGRIAVNAFWEFGAFVANLIVFLLIGAREHDLWEVMVHHIGLVGLGIAFTLLGRIVSVYGLSACFCRSRWKIDLRHQHVLVWGGLRGALSLALALSLPEGFAFREEIIAVTFGVVAFSLIVQGMTMAPLMRRLKLA